MVPHQSRPYPWGLEFVAVSVTDGGAEHELVPGTKLRIRFQRNRGIALEPGLPGQLDHRARHAEGDRPQLTEQSAWFTEFLYDRPIWDADRDGLTLRRHGTVIRLDLVAIEVVKPPPGD